MTEPTDEYAALWNAAEAAVKAALAQAQAADQSVRTAAELSPNRFSNAAALQTEAATESIRIAAGLVSLATDCQPDTGLEPHHHHCASCADPLRHSGPTGHHKCCTHCAARPDRPTAADPTTPCRCDNGRPHNGVHDAKPTGTGVSPDRAASQE